MCSIPSFVLAHQPITRLHFSTSFSFSQIIFFSYIIYISSKSQAKKITKYGGSVKACNGTVLLSKELQSYHMFPGVPLIDLSNPDSKLLLVKACQEFGFFKVINHGVPTNIIAKLESEAIKFFSLPLSEKEKAGPPNPSGYGNKSIGSNDVGWVEYILLNIRSEFDYKRFECIFGVTPENLRSAVNEYLSAVKKMACEILELMAEGLNIEPKNVISKLIMEEQSDSAFRLNHYPPVSPQVNELHGKNLIGFGEHTDPQIISVLRSNNTCGLQIALKDQSWISIPPDQTSFFVNVGDSLQVLTNGRFKSVKHRVVLANSLKSRLSMIYFGGPPLTEKIAPLTSLMEEEEDSLYEEFTWFEYKISAYNSRLSDNRLGFFEKIAAS